MLLLIVSFIVYFCAADLKGIWNDDAVRLTIANGGIATANLEQRHPGNAKDVIKAIGTFACQPLYPLIVNRVLRLTHSYSVIPIVTANLLIFLFSAIGIYLLARRLLPTGPRLAAMILYLWNGFAMVHVLQVREYPLILCFLVYNTFFFYYLLDSSWDPPQAKSWFIAATHCLTASGAYFTTSWAPFFLWPQAVIALLAMRRRVFSGSVVLASLFVSGVSALPWLLRTPKNSALFTIWDKRTPSLGLLMARLYQGSEYLLIGSLVPSRSLLHFYCCALLLFLLTGLLVFTWRFFREGFEIQHIVLTIVGFLALQVAYFFFVEPLSTWPRYFIFYLPYVVLIIPLAFFRGLVFLSQPAARRALAYVIFICLASVAGLAQLGNNYQNPYVDHGPDFRVVYWYLISRVAPQDKIVVGAQTNLMAFNYYWPTPRQIQFRYDVVTADQIKAFPSIWTISYQDEESPAYRAYAEGIQRVGYQLRMTHRLSNVTVRRFQSNP